MSWWKRLFGFEATATQASNAVDNPEEDELPSLGEHEDPLYCDAVQFVLDSRRASISAVQRKLNIGYNRAAGLVESMEQDGIVSHMDSNGVREVIVAGVDLRSLAKLRQAQNEAEEQALRQRIRYLLEKYEDEEIVKRIVQRNVWEGMTSAQLFDALGAPEAVDQKYLKKVSREIWKYLPVGSNRYAAKVTLENGIVVGWDFKG